MATEEQTEEDGGGVATAGDDTLSVTDNRTGKSYELEITDDTVRAMDLRQIKVDRGRLRDDGLRPGLHQHGVLPLRDHRTSTARPGILQHRGYPIEQLCEQSSYVEVAYLLIFGELPTAAQLERWTFDITHHTFVHEDIKHLFETFRYDAHPMGMLLSGFGALSTFYPDAKHIDDPEERYMAAIRMIAKVPTLAAFAYRHNMGLPYVYPDNDLSYPENFLSMMFKKTEAKYEPDPRLAKALDVLFILHADHEQNCSTSAVRGVGSSEVDPYSAVAAGVAALYGPLHGGANEAVLRMLRRIEDPANIPDFLEGVKNREERLMGFGHRVYKNYDPRARIIKKHLDDVLEATEDNAAGLDRDRAGEAGARRRLLHRAQALPERRLLLGDHLRGARDPGGHVHGDLRDPAYLGLGLAVDGDERRLRAEDRPSAPDLHRRARPRLRRRSTTARATEKITGPPARRPKRPRRGA